MIYKISLSAGRFTDVNVDTSNAVGSGGEASVYKAFIGKKLHAAKIFHDTHKVNVAKIRAMIVNPPTNLTGETAGIKYPRYAWPISFIFDSDNQPVGFLMPIIDIAESFTLDHYYDKNLIPKLEAPEEVALSYKIEIAANLSALIADLHRHEHYFIDFKPQNVRVFKRTHAVTLVDCDGFSIGSAEGNRYPAQLLSTDYISPEAFRKHSSAKDLGMEQDKYALAVIIFQLLNAGIHPFQGIMTDHDSSANTNDEKAAAGLYSHGLSPNPKIKPRPQSIHSCFDDQTRAMFDMAFTGSPEQRPSAEDWATHLQSILNNKMLGRCDAHPYDIRHMHLADKPCPACFLSAVERNGSIIVPRTVIDKSKLYVPEATPAYAPVSASTNQTGNLNWLWWVAAVIVVTVIANTGKESERQSPQPAQAVTPAPTPEQLAVDVAARRSDRMVELYRAGNYYGVLDMTKSGAYAPRDLNIIGLSYYATGHFDYAIVILQEAERAFPNESFIRSNLGDALFASGQSGAALEKYREALAMSPSNQTYQERVVKAEREVARLSQSNRKGDANIQWDNARYGVPLENEDAQERQEAEHIAKEKNRKAERAQARKATPEKSNFEAMLSAAKNGDAAAMNNLGILYSTGKIVQVDFKAAMYWFEKAANQGVGEGSANVGLLYENGWGVPVNYFEAANWYKKAIGQGENTGLAEFQLGGLYENGLGLREDLSKAAILYRTVVEKHGDNENVGEAKKRLSYIQNKIISSTDANDPQGKQNLESDQKRLEREGLAEKERLKNNADWLEREKENYRNRSF